MGAKKQWRSVQVGVVGQVYRIGCGARTLGPPALHLCPDIEAWLLAPA